MIIYVSKALQDSLKIKEADINRDIVQDEAYCWHGHLTKLNGKNTIILMNDKSTYCILLRNKLPRSADKFKELVKEAVYGSLLLTNADFEGYFNNMSDIVFSKNHNRKILGHINEATFEASYHDDLWSDTETLQVENMIYVNRSLRRMGKEYIEPIEEMRKIIF